MAQFLDYNKIIDQAMRGIVKKCLKFIEKKGGKLPGNHHFYITFDINHPGASISKNLAKMHQDQMTIVLQHQFWDLDVGEEQFSVVLSFNGVREKLVVPYEALISFADPSSRFGLQFNSEDDLIVPSDEESDLLDEEILQSLLDIDQETKKKPKKSEVKDKSDSGSKIISIDSFRKK